jgi:serine/threonine protein kinase
MENARRIEPEQQAGKYRPIADLGQGGTASVFLAVARGPSDFNKLVVLKMLKRELADESDFREMFLTEARLSARLNHPNVVQTNEILEVNGRPIIVMEYLEGQALSRIVSRTRGEGAHGEFPLKMHLRILAESLSGLHYAHELSDYGGAPLGLVHRDMTPQNVFVSYDGRVCLLDFGIAKVKAGAREQQTAVGVLKGKLRYMPPEQLLGPSVDRRTDVFAAGVMIWEAATGQRMWQGIAETTIMQRIACGELPTPSSVNPAVDAELERICMKALAHRREDRYQTAAELQTDLETYIAEAQFSPRAIGKFVDGLFSEERKQLRALIDRQLIAASSASAADSMDSMSEWNLPAAAQESSTQERTGSGPVTMTLPATRTRRRRSRLSAAAIGIAVITGGLLAWKQAPAAEIKNPPVYEEASRQAAAAEAPAAAAGALQPQEVQLRVSVLPAHAKIYLDDELVASNPYSAVVPASNEQHVLRVEAPGYATEVRSVSYSTNQSLELMLVKQQVAAEQPGPRPRRPRPVSASARPEPAVSDDDRPLDPCEFAYKVDEKGIRRLKPECLK